MRKEVVVIGAGIGGIAVAIRLARKGFKVTVIETNAQPGGKLSEIRQDGFRFDAGPSLFTLPELVEDLFVLCGKNPRDFFQYQRLEEICRYFYPDGLRLTAHRDPSHFAREISSKTLVSGDTVLHHLAEARQMYEWTEELFLKSSLHKWSSYGTTHAWKALRNVGKLQTHRTMHQVNAARFKDPRIAMLFDRYATYNGSNPYQAPATLNLIPHLEYNKGAYLPVGGMYAIVTSLVQLAKEQGVEFCFNEPAERIVLQGNQVIGVQTNKRFIPAARVVSNLDVALTYSKLLHDQKFLKTGHRERSTSAIVFYWGIKGNFQDLGLHNLFFSNDYKSEFSQLFHDGTVSNDPTVYLNISSKLIPSDAPKGHENWFTMVNVPPNTGQDWDQLICKSKDVILAKLSNALGTDIESRIVAESVLDPRKLESSTGAYQGSLYGQSSNSRFSAFLRHPNFHLRYKGLFFCGGTVHPGGGIPLCLNSAKIVGDLIN